MRVRNPEELYKLFGIFFIRVIVSLSIKASLTLIDGLKYG